MNASTSRIKIIRGGLLIDGTGRKPLQNPVVVVKGDRIIEVGEEGSVKIPEGEEIDAYGKTVMPGLIDCHLHLAFNGNPDWRRVMMEPLPITALRAANNVLTALQSGYTTVCDGGSPDGIMILVRNAIKLGIILGPRVFVSGRAITALGGHGDPMTYFPEYAEPAEALVPIHCWGRAANGAQEFIRAVREESRLGADFIKMTLTAGLSTPRVGGLAQYAKPTVTPDEARAACDEAHRLGRKVHAHLTSAEGIKLGVSAGVDVVVHGLQIDEEACILIRNNSRYLATTVAGYKYVMMVAPTPEDQMKLGIPAELVKRRFEAIEAQMEGYDARIRWLRLAKKAGVRIVPGCDYGSFCPLPHSLYATELESYVEAGYTPSEAIMAATRIAAQALGMEEALGTIERGKIADILIIDGNPIEKIPILYEKRPLVVMKEGEVVARFQDTSLPSAKERIINHSSFPYDPR